ncbi:MAG: hypothetical protein KBD01_14215 [Acidobacteria bacterium]|nr:hypothetical protein [Acidobacteriota bacterium]
MAAETPDANATSTQTTSLSGATRTRLTGCARYDKDLSETVRSNFSAQVANEVNYLQSLEVEVTTPECVGDFGLNGTVLEGAVSIDGGPPQSLEQLGATIRSESAVALYFTPDFPGVPRSSSTDRFAVFGPNYGSKSVAHEMGHMPGNNVVGLGSGDSSIVEVFFKNFINDSWIDSNIFTIRSVLYRLNTRNAVRALNDQPPIERSWIGTLSRAIPGVGGWL